MKRYVCWAVEILSQNFHIIRIATTLHSVDTSCGQCRRYGSLMGSLLGFGLISHLPVVIQLRMGPSCCALECKWYWRILRTTWENAGDLPAFRQVSHPGGVATLQGNSFWRNWSQALVLRSFLALPNPGKWNRLSYPVVYELVNGVFSFLAAKTERGICCPVWNKTFHHLSPTPLPGCTTTLSSEEREGHLSIHSSDKQFQGSWVEVWNGRLGLGQCWIVEWGGGIGGKVPLEFGCTIRLIEGPWMKDYPPVVVLIAHGAGDKPWPGFESWRGISWCKETMGDKIQC